MEAGHLAFWKTTFLLRNASAHFHGGWKEVFGCVLFVGMPLLDGFPLETPLGTVGNGRNHGENIRGNNGETLFKTYVNRGSAETSPKLWHAQLR